MRELINFMKALCLFVLMMVPVAFFLFSNSHITIERPYQIEYNQCQDKLSSCVESKTPSCAPCECKAGSDSIVFTVFGALFGIAGYVLYFVMMMKTNKLNEEFEKTKKKSK